MLRARHGPERSDDRTLAPRRELINMTLTEVIDPEESETLPLACGGMILPAPLGDET